MPKKIGNNIIVNQQTAYMIVNLIMVNNCFLLHFHDCESSLIYFLSQFQKIDVCLLLSVVGPFLAQSVVFFGPSFKLANETLVSSQFYD